MKIVEGNLIDVVNREIYPCAITISEGKIVSIERNSNSYNCYISPGLVDSHVHVESSMLLPTEFSRLAIANGTVAIVSDPHEIANVVGKEGIYFMLEDAKNTPLKCFWGIPSCVPATPFDRAGAKLSAKDTEELAKTGLFSHLSEMMNVPGVLNNDDEVLRKLAVAKKYNLCVDGHCPGLRGDDLSDYITKGVGTDHEAYTLEEAEEKIYKGMYIQIREGSAARNYDALKSLIATNTERVMFCTDDSHADDLLQQGHINKIVKKALADGFGIFDILQVACMNPVHFYHLDVGTLQIGDAADFIIVDDIDTFNILSVYINGEEVFHSGGKVKLKDSEKKYINYFVRELIHENEICLPVQGDVCCIKIIPDSLVTDKKVISFPERIDNFQASLNDDVLKLVYLNRYFNGTPQMGLISGLNLKEGAFATSISHDSHNIIAVGTNDADLTAAINAVIREKGGLALCKGKESYVLPLPIAGIMTDKSGEEVAEQYLFLKKKLKEWGCTLKAPFMTLSFMGLVVIPALKIGEKGLFDTEKFDFIKSYGN